MTIPANNRFFQKGLKGYHIHGRSKSLSGFSYIDGNITNTAVTITPIRGGRIAILDDPSFDPVTGRPQNNRTKPFDTSQFKIGSTTGVDGAILECRNVNIPANKALWFIWVFLPFESSTSGTFNNFAMFTAYQQNDLGTHGDFDHVVPFYSDVLGQSKKISDRSRSNLPWHVYSWQPAQHFFGTLCWIVSTGKFTRTNKKPHPSLLLLDTIDINRRE
jgi:hypothetical protein